MMIDVWEVTAEGMGQSYTERDVGIVSGLIKDMDEGSTISIYKSLMEEEKYNALPEFQGF